MSCSGILASNLILSRRKIGDVTMARYDDGRIVITYGPFRQIRHKQGVRCTVSIKVYGSTSGF